MVAVNVTEVPVQTLLELAVILTVGDAVGLTVIATMFEEAVVGEAHVLVVVTAHSICCPFTVAFSVYVLE
jgi:hypothetical protein